MNMNSLLSSLALIACASASSSSSSKSTTTCASNQVVVCQGNGNAGLVSLGNIAPGLLGDNCSGGDVYCCSEDDVDQVCSSVSNWRKISSHEYSRLLNRLAWSTSILMHSAALTMYFKTARTSPSICKFLHLMGFWVLWYRAIGMTWALHSESISENTTLFNQI